MHPETLCALDGPPACTTVETTYVTEHSSALGLLTAIGFWFYSRAFNEASEVKKSDMGVLKYP